MKRKPLTAALLLATLCINSSCKKNIDQQPPGEINGPTTVLNATADGLLETSLPTHTPRTVTINSNCLGYYETLPALYPSTTKKYPLIIFIHGIGELGTGLSRLNCCGLPYHASKGTFPAKFLVNGVYYSYIVVSPQFVVRPTAAQVQSVIDFAKAKYRVDETRIYVAGLSMGGGSALDWSMVYGEKAAAIVPVCPGTTPTSAKAQQVAAKNLPIWFLYSDADNVVPYTQGAQWEKLIDQYNPAYAALTKLTVFSGLSHNGCWAKAFNPLMKVDNKNIYEWMLLYSRGATTSTTSGATTTSNQPPIADAGSDRTIPLSWNYLPTLNGTLSNDPDGWIAAFKWSYVSGPSSYYIESPTSAKTMVTKLVAGTYVFRVMVTDSKGATDSDEVTITMTAD
jgi:predicted esterase